MSEPIASQSATSAEKSEHDNARFSHWEEEQAWEKEAQRRKVKIIFGFIAVGALVWAFFTFRWYISFI
jgi:hypothetical protein